MNLNILNPKALERQLKVVETRINELQTEIDGLEKIRAACLILMGNISVDLPSAEVVKENVDVAPPATKTKKPAPLVENIHEIIREVLHDRENGLTAEQIYEHLKSQGVNFGKKLPVNSVLPVLKKYPEMFTETQEGHWSEVRSQNN